MSTFAGQAIRHPKAVARSGDQSEGSFKPGFPFFIVGSFVFIHREIESWEREGGTPPGIALNKPLILLTEGTRLFNIMQTIYNLLIANSQRQHFGI